MPRAETSGTTGTVATALVLAVLVLAGWRVLSLGLADHFARDQPADALRWWPSHPEALLWQAEASSQAKDVPATRQAARHALQAYPLEGRPFRILAQVEADEAQAVGLYDIAVKRAPRDIATRGWLVEHHLKMGEVAIALGHLDAWLRVEPEAMRKVIPQLAALASMPETHEELARLLAGRPPWRKTFLTTLPAGVKDSAAIAPLMTLLRRAPGGLDREEADAWLLRLIRDERYSDAYVAWVSGLPVSARSSLGNVYNGSFELEPGPGFDWRFGRPKGTYIAREAVEGATGELALHLTFTGRRVAFGHVSQVILLSPGTWRLQLRGRADALSTENGLSWQLNCAGGKPLGATPPMAGRKPWFDLGVDFLVPPDCPAQILKLVLVARSEGERWASGEAWFDAISILPSSAEIAPPTEASADLRQRIREDLRKLDGKPKRPAAEGAGGQAPASRPGRSDKPSGDKPARLTDLFIPTQPGLAPEVGPK